MTSSIHPTVHLAKKTNIRGKWQGKTYRVIEKIGEGSRGSIYLVRGNQGIFALKISKDSSVITREAKILKRMKKVQGVQLGPSLLDVDDFVSSDGIVRSFYVMEYIDGQRVKDWYDPSKKGKLMVLMKQLLFQLHHLHLAGYIFGDLKLENLLIDRKTKQIRLVDFGGVTQMGRSVREYTSQYDRGYWQMGGRQAEPTYDLFALAICVLQLDPTFRRTPSSNKNLLTRIDRSKTLAPFHPLLKKAVKGHYKQALSMKKELDLLSSRTSTIKKQRRVNGRQPIKQRTTDAVQAIKNEIFGITIVFAGQIALFVGFYYWL